MSNTNTNSAEYEVVALPETLPEVLPEAQADVPETQPQQSEPKKKNVGTRILAAILVLLSVVTFAVAPFSAIGASVASASVLTLILETIASTTAILGVVPTLVDASTALGMITGLSLYLLAAGLVLSAVFGLIAVFTGKKGLVRTSSFFFALGVAVYTVFTLLYTFVDSKVLTLDIIALALTAVGVVLYLALALANVGKKAWASLLQFVLTAVVALVVIYSVSVKADVFNTALEGFGLGAMANTVELAVFALLALSVLLGFIRIQTKKSVIDGVRYVVQFILAVACAYLLSFDILVIVAAVLSLVQLVIAILQKKGCKKKVVEEEVVAEEEVPEVEEFVREEFAEAVAYEGGPVEGVEIAEEVNPTYTAPVTPVQTAGYDFYNTKSFDPFIAVLNNEERNQFTELFILKYRGVMPEVPDYVVGGDNSEFFRKLFIYLGQYRDRIPDGLLAKIYQFAIKM